MIGILTAVREELNPIIREMPSVERTSPGGITFYQGLLGRCPVVAAKSGMGGRRAGKAVEQMIHTFHPREMVICGFAGSLSESLNPGGLVIAARIYSEMSSGDNIPTQPDTLLFERAMAVADRYGGIATGGLLSTETVVQTSSHKRTLSLAHIGAIAVDMETSGAAEACAKAGVPWLGVRGITDGILDDLPFDFGTMMDEETGEVSLPRLAAAVLRRPASIPNLLRLGRRSGLAARNLARFVESYVELADAANRGAQQQR